MYYDEGGDSFDSYILVVVSSFSSYIEVCLV